MKRIFLALCVISISVYSYGQKHNCKSLHEGVFKLLSDQTGVTVITRNKNIQTEINEKLATTIVYNVTWIDDCTYELRLKKQLSGDTQLAGKKDDVLTVKILKVKDKSYTARTSANFTTLTLEREIQIVK